MIDDDEAIAKTFVRLLRLHEFDAYFALTGADALSSVVDSPPHAVVLDLHLAADDIPGFLVLKFLRAKYPNLPIVAVTGWYLRDQHEVEARAIGASDYLLKPVEASQVAISLRAAISKVEQLRSERRSTESANAPSSAGWRSMEVQEREEGEYETAGAEDAFISTRLTKLARRIQRAFPGVWEDVIAEQVENALLGFLSNVRNGVWPARGSIDGYLRQAAWGDVRDQLQMAARRAANEARYASETTSVEKGDTGQSLHRLDAVLSLARTDAEREAVRCWAKDDDPFSIAKALGASHLPAAAQLSEVKRFKDRMRLRARRSKSCWHRRDPTSTQ